MTGQTPQPAGPSALASLTTLLPARDAWPKLLLLAAGLLMSLRILQFFPGMFYIQEAWFVLGFGFILFRLYTRYYLRLETPRGFELYYLSFFALVPAYSALVAMREFGQPAIYGLLAQRNFVLATALPAALAYGFEQGKLELKDMERVFLFLAWSTLLLFLGATMLLDPAQFYEPTMGFVVQDFTTMQYKFKFDNIFIVFGFLYHAYQAVRLNNRQMALLAAPFLLYLVIESGGRSGLTSLGLAFLIPCMVWLPRKAIPHFLIRLAAVLLVALALITIAKPDQMELLKEKFYAAYDAVFQGGESTDPSANSRMSQAEAILPLLGDKLVFGFGQVSTQWEGGAAAAIGTNYFHASDLGLLGVAFQYGLVGLGFFLAQLAWAWRFLKRAAAAPGTQSAFRDGLLGLFLFYAISSITTGRLAFFPEMSLMLLLLIERAGQAPTPEPLAK